MRRLFGTEQAGSAAKKRSSTCATSDTLMFYFVPVYPLNMGRCVWAEAFRVGGAPDRRYIVETTTKIVERCMLMTTEPGDLVLDPTCGSGTSASVAEQWGRRYRIMIDTSRGGRRNRSPAVANISIRFLQAHQ